MTRKAKNIAASVHQRLLDRARESHRPFNELLQNFAIERFIYRLSMSSYRDAFILKGALLFSVWRVPESQPTLDIDLLGRIDNRIGVITAALRDVCNAAVETDGMSFNPDTVAAVRIAGDAEYEGVRVRLKGGLGNARVSLQVDIGFGDTIVPGPCEIEYPVLLDFPPPKLSGYSIESTIAEKYQAMVKLGILNSRMKNFYDIWMLSRSFEFRGEILAEALEKTFANRDTVIAANPRVFDSSFAEDGDKNIQWRAFTRKSKLDNAPETFSEVVAAVNIFLEPLLFALSRQEPFHGSWSGFGPWR